MNIHLYLLAYRFEALVASQLEPEAFGRYMAVGTVKLSRGSVLYFEVERARIPAGAFRLDDLEQRCRTPDGAPKRSKYVAIYRVLERLPLNALGTLWLTTADGRALPLAPAPALPPETKGPFLYQELSPVTPMIASSLPAGAFVRFITEPENPLVVPRLFFTELLLDRDEGGHLAGYLPYADPLHLLDCIRELEHAEGGRKPTKTVSRTPEIIAFYRTVGRGFFVGDREGTRFYPFPERRDLELHHPQWWRSAQNS